VEPDGNGSRREEQSSDPAQACFLTCGSPDPDGERSQEQVMHRNNRHHQRTNGRTERRQFADRLVLEAVRSGSVVDKTRHNIPEHIQASSDDPCVQQGLRGFLAPPHPRNHVHIRRNSALAPFISSAIRGHLLLRVAGVSLVSFRAAVIGERTYAFSAKYSPAEAADGAPPRCACTIPQGRMIRAGAVTRRTRLSFFARSVPAGHTRGSSRRSPLGVLVPPRSPTLGGSPAT
jgi:hypothetical protein